MNEYFPVIIAVIGMIGVAVGAMLNEVLRRHNRRELYAPQIFEKRLAVYENLIEKIHVGSNIANDVIKNKDLTQDQRHDLISIAVQDIAEFTDIHRLYLDEEISLHCVALFMGVEDIHNAAENDKKQLLDNFYQMRKEALRMVAEDSGVAEINRLFKAINKPTIDGDLIRYYRKIK